jgi:GDP-L-fucose synthase
MVGSAIARHLRALDPGAELVTRTRAELDLTDQPSVDAFFKNNRIDQVYLAAAKVGGIVANNTYPAEFIRDNLAIQSNVIHAAYASGIQRLLFLGTSCIYPRDAAQPIKESYLLTGTLEPTNEPYAIAKIAGIKMCESYNRQYGVDFRSVMPTNLYGENDNFHPENSHVIPSLLRRFHLARLNGSESVVVWGTGTPRREFLHVDDMAAACVHVMNLERQVYERCTQPMVSHINVGTGQDVSIEELANQIKSVVGFEGRIDFDTSKPDGTPRKLLDVERLHSTGWTHRIDLPEGLRSTYDWFVSQQGNYRA